MEGQGGEEKRREKLAGLLPVTNNAAAETDVLLDAWDLKSRPAPRASTGRWGAAAMILVAELNERLTTLAIAVDVVTYLTGTMLLGSPESADVMGTSLVLLCLLLVGFVADSFLGRYDLTVAIFTAVQASTPVMLAAMHGKIDCVLKLLQAGANPAVAEGTSPKPPTDRRGPIRPRDIVMASVASGRSLALVAVVVAVSVTGAAAGSNKSFNITNHCSYTVWPGILSGAAVSSAPVLCTTGFELAPRESRSVSVPSGWSGSLWGRTLCSTNATTGKFTCVTGDCGSGKQDCAGGWPAPPVTLAEFSMDGSGGMDFYDVSLVDGFNLPMLVAPQGAAPGGNCAPTGCMADLNTACPPELRVMSPAAGTGAVACKSACLAFGTPDTCKPSSYSELFKHTCPRAFSYAYDSVASTFTCGGGGDTAYTITFCPGTASGAKSSSPNSQPAPPGADDPPHIDVTVVGNTGGNGQFPAWSVVAGALSVLAAVLGVIIGCCKYIIKRRAKSAAAAGEKEIEIVISTLTLRFN